MTNSSGITVNVRAELDENAADDLSKELTAILNKALGDQNVLNQLGSGGTKGGPMMSEKMRATLGIMEELSDSFKSVGNAISGLIRTTLGYVEDIYKQMKKSSPLLETVENLFTLAVNLFFMPLGNKLAEVMIPALVALLDAVVDIWDKFEGKTLGEMFSIAITEGVKLVSAYFMNLGSLLSEQGGIVGSIGRMIQVIGAFIQKHGEQLLGLVTGILSFIMNNLAMFIGAAVGFFTTAITLMTMIHIATIIAGGWKGVLGSLLVGGISTGVGIGAGMGASAYAQGLLNESSYEYVSPAPSTTSNYTTSKVGNVGGNMVNNFYFEGLTNDELKYVIRDEVNGMISQSKYRGAY